MECNHPENYCLRKVFQKSTLQHKTTAKAHKMTTQQCRTITERPPPQKKPIKKQNNCKEITSWQGGKNRLEVLQCLLSVNCQYLRSTLNGLTCLKGDYPSSEVRLHKQGMEADSGNHFDRSSRLWMLKTITESDGWSFDLEDLGRTWLTTETHLAGPRRTRLITSVTLLHISRCSLSQAASTSYF